ncbi:MAG: hypothetical protein LCH86_19710 [Proteobacteria bacterium]|jgi:hypothetical protein|uniref:hypothetical protein n=1 Tax=Hyphomicrobiales TaxID=356 RepID=UPI00036084A0|nr:MULTISPECIES: hypothetical protein [Phyllobacteriaceae]MCA0278231.1 hypothetical protein [Pseudomonadota bacterium]MCX8571609.1 hypothetical protein [Aminobacter sp. MET-1]
MMEKRYELVLDPSDLWTVWDNKTEEPAMLGFAPLIGLTKPEASIACALLNDVELKNQAAKVKKPRGKSAA